MNCLAIDTTTDKLYLALITDSGTHTRTAEVGKAGLSRAIMPEIDSFLSAAGVDKSSIGCVSATVGPGSFTGIRIGVAAMTAAAFALNAKRIAVTSFELLAYNRANAKVAVDAGHGNCYVAETRDGEIVSTDFLESVDCKALASEYAFDPALPRERALAEVVKEKLNLGEFCNVLEPVYLRKSQAEREKDEV